MRFSKKSVCLIVVAMLALFFSSGYFAAEKPECKNTKDNPAKLILNISADGKTIIDQDGNEIARFSEGIKVSTAKAVEQKLQGCMRCWYECVTYEGEKCVQWVRTCEWDFDCK